LEVSRLYLQIRYLRELKGLSLLDVSERSGVTVAQLSRVERGLSKPRPSTLRKIAQALNVNVEELWTPDEGKHAA
jgi:transcriptional regulator with XRE-family HTH domain